MPFPAARGFVVHRAALFPADAMTARGNGRNFPRPKRGGIPSGLPNKEGADLSAGQCCPSGDVPSHAYPRPIDKGEARPGDRRRKHLPKEGVRSMRTPSSAFWPHGLLLFFFPPWEVRVRPAAACGLVPG